MLIPPSPLVQAGLSGSATVAVPFEAVIRGPSIFNLVMSRGSVSAAASLRLGQWQLVHYLSDPHHLVIYIAPPFIRSKLLR